jgi:uncharacterized membrane protein YdjX (TVP38/TMEM64 family)
VVSTPEPRTTSTWSRWITAATVVGAALLFALPGPRTILLTAGGHLVRFELEELQTYLRTFEGTAWIWTSLLMLGQGLAAPIPALPITLTNALIYGTWLGALISWLSAQAAAFLCFAIARALGRPVAARFVSERALDRFDAFFARYGLLTVLVARLVPIVPFDVVSYAAGLTRLRTGPFLLATGLGQLPATIVYSAAGARLATSPSTALLIVLWFLGPAVLGTVLAARRLRKPDGSG